MRIQTQMNKGTQKGEGPETEGKVRDCRRKAEPSASLNQGQREKHWETRWVTREQKYGRGENTGRSG